MSSQKILTEARDIANAKRSLTEFQEVRRESDLRHGISRSDSDPDWPTGLCANARPTTVERPVRSAIRPELLALLPQWQKNAPPC
jgi:hypothetical protein